MNNETILAIVNANLGAMFPEKHTPIILADVEKVYDRNVLGTANAKTTKGDKRGYMTGILYLAPAKLSGIEVCPGRSLGCTAACLFTAGRGRFYSITRARVIKTLAYHFDKPRFVNTLKKSISQVITKARNKNMTPVIRLNGTSDIPWELTTDIIQSFPSIQFYDYTKLHGRFSKPLPKNYSLTYSVSESNHDRAREVLSNKGNLAAVFKGPLPKKLWGFKVIDGDETDLRFLDAKNVIAGLKAKGKAKKDTTGFVLYILKQNKVRID